MGAREYLLRSTWPFAFTLAIACTPPSAPAPPERQAEASVGAPDDHAREGSAEAQASPPGDAASATDEEVPFREIWSRWRTSGESQVGWAELMRLAVQRGDSRAAELTLRELARRMSVWRAQGWEPAAVRAVQRWAAPSNQEARLLVDPRTVVPALELLIDVGDAAALERLVGERDAGPAEAAFRSAVTVAASILPDAHIEAPADCALVVDGVDTDASSARVRPGSHEVRCAQGEPIHVAVRAGETVALSRAQLPRESVGEHAAD